MGGRIIVESVAGCLWNRWPDGRGIRISISVRRVATKRCIKTASSPSKKDFEILSTNPLRE
ncbi:hypothetical protein FJD35_32755 [Pseudomonas mandelii]|nr:hypothetical protein FJD35_32755 [Pseudomonas mandelii]